MSDIDDPNNSDPKKEGLERHIQLDHREEGPEWPEKLKVPLAPEPALEALVAKRPGVVSIFFQDLINCLTEPRYFFRERYPQITFNYALTFGIVVNWIAAILDWLTRLVRHETLMDGLLKMRDKLHDLPFWKSLPENFWAQQTPGAPTMFPAWIAEMFGIALSPFQTLIRLCVGGFILYLGAYFMVQRKPDANQDPIDIKALIKLVCFTSAPVIVSSILGFLPLGLGALFGGIYAFALLMIALITRYQVSGLRAFAIVILPGLVSIVALGCIIGIFAALFFGVVAALFGSSR